MAKMAFSILGDDKYDGQLYTNPHLYTAHAIVLHVMAHTYDLLMHRP